MRFELIVLAGATLAGVEVAARSGGAAWVIALSMAALVASPLNPGAAGMTIIGVQAGFFLGIFCAAFREARSKRRAGEG